jgi:DNA-binding NarL/FixJ family response regulator
MQLPDSSIIIETLDTALALSVPVLARFLLHGRECLVVPAGDDAPESSSAEILGVFTLSGQCYSIRLMPPADQPAADLIEKLTPREFQIARLIAGGDGNKTIARRLRISAYTVAAHVGRIFAKLGIHKRTELTACIVRHLVNGG